MSRRLSGLSKTDLVNFIFTWCQDCPQFQDITKVMLRKEHIDNLDKTRWAIINDNGINSRVLRRLIGGPVSSQTGSSVVQSDLPTDRAEVIAEIWRFCQRKRLYKYLNKDMLRAQDDMDLRRALSAIRHGSFPRLINGLLSRQPRLPL